MPVKIDSEIYFQSFNVDWAQISKEDQKFIEEKFPNLAMDMIFRFPRHPKEKEQENAS